MSGADGTAGAGRTARDDDHDLQELHDPHDPGAVGLVDWGRTGRRVRTSVVVLTGGVLVVWAVLSLVGGGFDPGTLGGLIGLAMAGMFVIELVVIGGAALRGMLRAGERGERLSSRGVGLLPPRIRVPGTGGADQDGATDQ